MSWVWERSLHEAGHGWDGAEGCIPAFAWGSRLGDCSRGARVKYLMLERLISKSTTSTTLPIILEIARDFFPD